MTDDKGAGEPFAKAIRKGVLIAQDLEPGMSIMVGGYVFTGKYTTWADQINRALDEMVKAERERCAKIIDEEIAKAVDEYCAGRGAGDRPYTTGDSDGLVFLNGRGVENFDSRRDAMNAASLGNAAYAEGRKAERERCAKIAKDYFCVKDGVAQAIEKEIRGGQDGK